ncbi:SusC/RagA family TonB-linked outer membrane protein [uncultured Chitinophaga sp.]|uniref:SusC/RagA family TonB-linked outer membrane protein n=1 Tax=uncultured Chitinophaga sp. TaxID=339340 RepID=UPI0025D1CFEA|nr:SusC/RagA family TonB-linked outer membrane protein [uncultured Chitinophaga sp.]
MKKQLAGVFTMLCLTLSIVLHAQQKKVTGTVTDRNGAVLPGATVTVNKGKTGTVTNTEGKFEIAAPDDGNVTINFTGYKSQTVKVGASGEVNVSLQEDVAKLDEVIVTGLATTVKRRNLANAVATVSAKELSGTAPAQTFDAALNGKITGANIVANSGAPGGGISVKLRGVTTFYGSTEPLYVIDGVIISNRAVSGGLNAVTAAGGGAPTSDQDNAPGRIADINPADIENIEVLKGASASAIYGSQAAAGVVVITTKKGRAGKTKISLNQDLGVISVRHLLGTRELNEDRVRERTRWRLADYQAAVAAGKIYDYEKELYGNDGFTRNTSLSASGGNEKTTFLFSAGNKDEDGIIKRTGYENSSVRVNVDHRLSDKVKIGLTSTYIRSSTDRGITNNDNRGVTFGVALSTTPSFMELHPNENGIYPRNRYASSNPLETRDKMRNNELVNRFVGGVNLEATLQQSALSTTRFIGRAGVDYFNMKSMLLFPSTLQFQSITRGQNVQGNANNLFTNWSAFLVNTISTKSNLSFTSTLGLTHETGNFDQILNVATQLIGEQTSLDQAGAIDVTQSRTSFRNDGLFVQEEISIKEFLNLTAGIRFDKSTNNGDHEKYYLFPKANIAWNLTKMAGWSNSILNDLKLRVAYGEGNGLPTFNSRFTTLTGSNIGGKPGSAIYFVLGNENIEPERQTELEGGVDISFLDGKISLEATYYNKVIRNMLLQAEPPGSTGFAVEWINGGKLRNRGLELGLRTVPVSTKNIRWGSNLNVWFNRSTVLELNTPAFDPGGSFGATYGTYFVEEGKPATQIIGVIDAEGNTAQVGNSEPDFQASWFNEVTLFKNLSLRFFFHWKNGGDNVNLTQLLNDGGGTSADFDVLEANGQKRGRNRLNGFSSYVQDASYLRLRELGLYYRLPLNLKFMEGITIGASANNYFTWTKYKGYDPEVSNFGTGFSTGIDVAPYPATKRLQFHLAFNF